MMSQPSKKEPTTFAVDSLDFFPESPVHTGASVFS